MAAKKGTWVAGTVVASVAIMAGAWLLAINPQLSEAAGLRDQTASVESQNSALSDTIEQLKKDFAHLDEYKGQLADLRTQIPTTDALSEYVREIDTIAAQHQVVVTNLVPSPAQAFVPAQVAAPAAPTEEPTDPAAEESTDPTAEASPTADATTEAPVDPGDTTATPAPDGGASVPEGFAAIPVSITVVGTYDNTVAFLNSLQTGTKRLFLVSGITGTSQKDGEATGGKPATVVGDQELVVTGFLYALPDPLASLPAPDGAEAPTPAPSLPAPPPGRNPLVPVAGE